MKVKPEDSLKIENIVASAKVTDYLDLPALASQIKSADAAKRGSRALSSGCRIKVRRWSSGRER